MKKNNYSSIETIIKIARKGGMFILVDDESEFMKKFQNKTFGFKLKNAKPFRIPIPWKGQLGFFDPQLISPDFKNINPNDGTVDLEYTLVETGSSQIELQGGYGGGGFIGTIGLSFNNFSIKDIFKKEAYKKGTVAS